jgi:dolichol-phosphate mannosyltransferase
LVLVNDGSRDRTLHVMNDLAMADARVTAVDLARNFGHPAAISAGLDHSRGRAVVVMDADLQDPPEMLPKFLDHWRAGFEVVYAVRRTRPETWPKRAAYAAFYRLMRRISEIPIPLDAGDFCLMDRRVVDLLAAMPERNRFLRGMRSWVGLKQIGLEYDRGQRMSGVSNYTIGRLMALALDGVFSFSFLPLRVISLVGLAVSVLSILLAVAYAVQKMVRGLEPPGFATIVVSIFFLAGVQLITLGVLGEYVGRIFEEVRRRPLYVVHRVVRHGVRMVT